MKLEERELITQEQQGSLSDNGRETDSQAELDRAPVTVDRAGRPVLFGPGVDDFNQYDDPC